MFKYHCLNPIANIGLQRFTNDYKRVEDVNEAQGIVQQQSAAVAGDGLSTIGCDQIGEDGEESDGGIVGDELNELQHDIGQVGQELTHDGLAAAIQVHGKAKEDGENNQGQHCTAARSIQPRAFAIARTTVLPSELSILTEKKRSSISISCR